MKRIAFVSARSAYVMNEQSFIMYWADARLLNELLKFYGNDLSIAVFSNPQKSTKYSVTVEPSQVYTLPFPFSYSGGLKNSLRIFRMLKAIEKEHDVLVVQLPFIGFLPLLFLKKPVLFHVCANVVTGGENKTKYRGLMYTAAFTFSRIVNQIFKILFNRKQNSIIVNGDELGELYHSSHPKVVVSSSIYAHEILSESDVRERNTGEMFKLLFIGRPTVDKGYLVLIQAFSKLIDEGRDVTLTVIGATKKELPDICGIEIEEKYFSKIHCAGYLTWGDDFQEIIRSCHCLIMSSLSSEGTPRVLIEARAMGCPIIATDVGGVRSSVTHEQDGLIVPIGEAMPIVSSIKRLIDNERFRINLILKGLVTVKKYTVEKFAHELIEAMQTLIKKNY